MKIFIQIVLAIEIIRSFYLLADEESVLAGFIGVSIGIIATVFLWNI